MEEQSHKDEMRAALRGDFERMRRRQAGDGDAGAPAIAPAMVSREQPQVVPQDEPSGSWLGRLLGRS